MNLFGFKPIPGLAQSPRPIPISLGRVEARGPARRTRTECHPKYPKAKKKMSQNKIAQLQAKNVVPSICRSWTVTTVDCRNWAQSLPFLLSSSQASCSCARIHTWCVSLGSTVLYHSGNLLRILVEQVANVITTRSPLSSAPLREQSEGG